MRKLLIMLFALLLIAGVACAQNDTVNQTIPDDTIVNGTENNTTDDAEESMDNIVIVGFLAVAVIGAIVYFLTVPKKQIKEEKPLDPIPPSKDEVTKQVEKQEKELKGGLAKVAKPQKVKSPLREIRERENK